MAKTICLAQSKGGTGKSTSTLNMGAVLVERNYRVLVVDTDQQANLTIGLNVNPLELRRTMRALLTDPNITAKDVIVSTSEGLDLIPANLDLAFVERAMPELAREKVLARKLAAVQNQYDFILIDTPPSFGTVVANAMVASDYVLVPVQPEPFCIAGLVQLIENLESIRQNVHPGLHLIGLFVTLYDNREAAHIQITERLRHDWDDYMLNTVIRDSSLNDRASVEARPIVRLRPRSGIAQDYQALVEEVLNRVN